MAESTVLLYYNDAVVLKRLSQTLGSFGLSVISSSDQQYALELARQEKPQFLIWGDALNLQTKKILRSLKQSESGQNLSIIAVGSANDLKLYDRLEAQHYGIDDFIPHVDDIAEIQTRIHFHQRYINQIDSSKKQAVRFKKLSEATLSLMLSKGITNISEILNEFFLSSYPLSFLILAIDISQTGEFDYFNISSSGKKISNIESIKNHEIWKKYFFSNTVLQIGAISDTKIVKIINQWGLNFKTLYQYPLQPRGKGVGIVLFALKEGTTISNEEETLLEAFLRSVAQRLIEVKRIYSLDRVGINRRTDVKSYFQKPSEEEIVKQVCSLIIGQFHPDICLYINYHEGFKFLYPKYCFKGEDNRNIFEKDKPPVLLIKDFQLFQSIAEEKKSFITNLQRNQTAAELKKLPGLSNSEINNILIIPLIVAQSNQGFLIVGRESYIEKFSNREIQESEKLVRQAADALEEDQILRTAKLTVKQLNRIIDLGSELTLDLTLESLLKKVCNAIRRTLAWNVVILDIKSQYDETYQNLQILGMNEDGYQKLIKSTGYPSFNSRLEISFPISNSYFFDHKIKYSEKEPTSNLHFKEQMGSEWNDDDWVYVPVRSRGKLLGVISLNDPVERKRPNGERIKSVEYFANQAAVIIENYELIEGLKSSELKYRMLAETMTMGLVTCDPERNIIYANQSLAQLLKYDSVDELINKKLCEFTEPDAKHKLIKEVHRVLQDKTGPLEIEEASEGLELDFIAKDGESLPFMVFISPFYQHGKKIGFFSVLSDLRNQKKIERLKADFNSMIVHDLRSPLNIIQGYVDIVRTEVVGPITEEQAELLTIAKENVFKVLKLIDNFLTASKLEAGHFQIEPSVNSMNGLIDTLWDHYQVLANEKKIKLVKDLDENLPLLSFDKFRIEQVVRNFLSNALKFTPPEGTITISTKLKKTKNTDTKDMQMHADVVVQDTGVGIPEEELNKVFNKYEQTEAGKDASLKGTGLGLAICREIVDLHGGEVWVKSVLHQGSDFGFSLPIQAVKL